MIMKKLLMQYVTLTLLFVVNIHVGADNMDASIIKNIESISNKKIYFGHQSVGYNIINGIKKYSDAIPEFKIHDSFEFAQYEGPMLAHSRNGYNWNPESKIISFANTLNNLKEWKPDIAMFKFCYVDFNNETDIDKLYQSYRLYMDRLQTKYPDLTIVYMTVPLTTIQSGIKAQLKKMLGRPLAGVEENIARNKFNDLLRRDYSQSGRLFDIAMHESTLPSGERESFVHNNNKYYHLAGSYSSDGGHLNERGQDHLAKEFLNFIANLE